MRSKSIVMGWLGGILTLLKFFLAWLIVVLIESKHNGLAGFGVFCLMISDAFDGVIFRKSTIEIQRKFGFLRRVLDVVGDRFSIYWVLATMVTVTNLPIYIYGVEMAREVALILIVVYSWGVRRPIVKPNNISRTATFCTGLSAIAWLNSQPTLAVLLISLTGTIGTVGLWKYYQTTKEIGSIKDRRRG